MSSLLLSRTRFTSRRNCAFYSCDNFGVVLQFSIQLRSLFFCARVYNKRISFVFFYGRKFSSSCAPFVWALQAVGVSMHAINKGPKYLQAHYGNNLINLKQYANGSTKHDDDNDDDDEVVWQISLAKLFDFWLSRRQGEGHELFACVWGHLPGSLRVVAINQHFMQSCAQLSKSWNAFAKKLSAAGELCAQL